MRNCVLSLRNLYSFIVDRDYPVYSAGVIGNEYRKGMTLVKFWKDNLVPEFLNGTCGRVIWKDTNSRNRHTSEICNRSSRLGIYGKYMEEITSVLQPELVLRQIEQFRFFFTNRKFSYSAFMEKLKILLQRVPQEDPAWNQEIRDFFADSLRVVEAAKVSEEQESFAAGWLLSLLVIHALAGSEMQDYRMQELRKDERYGFAALLQKMQAEAVGRDVVFLTNRNCEICREALPQDNFWGREKETFELREMLKTGGYYLLSGIGGIGKTELLRQLLQYCLKNRAVEYICAIQYENNMQESLLRAFPGRGGDSAEEQCAEALARMKMYAAKHRLLILVDNVGTAAGEDAGLRRLTEIPCSVIMTSRLRDIEGFETYPVSAPDTQACELIFRDNCERRLTKEDQENLFRMLEYPVFRHTLTLRLLGQLAYSMQWSVGDILLQFEESGGELISWREGGRSVSLKKIYTQLYSKLCLRKKQKSFLRVLASLPYRRYPLSYLTRYLKGFMETDGEGFVEELSKQGWLEAGETGIVMHPVIAESILDSPLTEEEFGGFLADTAEEWKQAGIYTEEGFFRLQETMEADTAQSAEALIGLVFEMPQYCRAEDIPLLLCAVQIDIKSRMWMSGHAQRLKEIVMPFSDGLDEIRRIQLYTICMQYMKDEMDMLCELMQKQQSKRTIPDGVYGEFVSQLAMCLMFSGEVKRAEECFQVAEAYIAGIDAKMDYYYNVAALCLMKMEQDRLKENVAAGIELAMQDPEKHRERLFRLRGLECMGYIGSLKYDEAEESLNRMEEYLDGYHAEENWYFNFYKGVLYTQTDRVGSGVPYLKKAIEYAGYYYGENSLNYAMECEELALAQGKLKQYAESEKNHRRALNFLTKNEDFLAERMRVENNMGVMYLQWGKDDAALKHLTEAYHAGEDNGLTAAEAAYNLSKLYRRRGDSGQELFYLREAFPVFETRYADRSPKTAEVRERIAALEKES